MAGHGEHKIPRYSGCLSAPDLTNSGRKGRWTPAWGLIHRRTNEHMSKNEVMRLLLATCTPLPASVHVYGCYCKYLQVVASSNRITSFLLATCSLLCACVLHCLSNPARRLHHLRDRTREDRCPPAKSGRPFGASAASRDVNIFSSR
jgi:hypothetical protein